MLRELTVRHRNFPLVAPFRIARGVKHAADVVLVELRQGEALGRGESVPYARYGESVDSVLAQLEEVRAEVAAGMGREALQSRLPAGAARNALDAALWDLEAQLTSVPVWSRLARASPHPLASAVTVGIDTPRRMGEEAARLVAGRPRGALIKIKLDAQEPGARIEAVRRAAPDARLIIDPNESWDLGLLEAMQPVLEDAGVELVEQPLPAASDEALADLAPRVPVCADESCHVAADLPRLRRRYQAVNIKLDKAGGLTEAWNLLHAARAEGFRIMVGCMVCSSLGIAPALEVAREAEFIDLDGPLWLQEDYAGGVRLEQGLLLPPRPGFWGG